MKNNMNLWTIIGIVIVVAVIASLITTGITGNVIVDKSSSEVKACVKECQSSCLQLPLKERASCRSKCTGSCKYVNVTTNQGVLEMLNKCKINSNIIQISKDSIFTTCDAYCKSLTGKYTCIGGSFMLMEYDNPQSKFFRFDMNCDEPKEQILQEMENTKLPGGVQCVCCSP